MRTNLRRDGLGCARRAGDNGRYPAGPDDSQLLCLLTHCRAVAIGVCPNFIRADDNSRPGRPTHRATPPRSASARTRRRSDDEHIRPDQLTDRCAPLGSKPRVQGHCARHQRPQAPAKQDENVDHHVKTRDPQTFRSSGMMHSDKPGDGLQGTTRRQHRRPRATRVLLRTTARTAVRARSWACGRCRRSRLI
jgi:hypothetical protein